MATLTYVVTGKLGDALSSDETQIVDEIFHSIFDKAVKLIHHNLQAGTSVVTTMDGLTTYNEGVDYTMDNTNGTITVLSTGTMADATQYLIDYHYNEISLASKINAITTVAQAAGKWYRVEIAKAMGDGEAEFGVAVIVRQA